MERLSTTRHDYLGRFHCLGLYQNRDTCEDDGGAFHSLVYKRLLLHLYYVHLHLGLNDIHAVGNLPYKHAGDIRQCVPEPARESTCG
jgi:hypothetical protein